MDAAASDVPVAANSAVITKIASNDSNDVAPNDVEEDESVEVSVQDVDLVIDTAASDVPVDANSVVITKIASNDSDDVAPNDAEEDESVEVSVVTIDAASDVPVDANSAVITKIPSNDSDDVFLDETEEEKSIKALVQNVDLAINAASDAPSTFARTTSDHINDVVQNDVVQDDANERETEDFTLVSLNHEEESDSTGIGGATIKASLGYESDDLSDDSSIPSEEKRQPIVDDQQNFTQKEKAEEDIEEEAFFSYDDDDDDDDDDESIPIDADDKEENYDDTSPNENKKKENPAESPAENPAENPVALLPDTAKHDIDSEGHNGKEDDFFNNDDSSNFKSETASLGDALDEILDQSDKASAEDSYDVGAREVSQMLRSTSSISSSSSFLQSPPPRMSISSTQYNQEHHQYSSRTMEFEMPETIGYQLDSSRQKRMHLPRPDPGHRLYVQGVESERKKALQMKRVVQESQQGQRLNLIARSYSSRPMSTSRPSSNGPKSSVYSRLYDLSKDKKNKSSGKTNFRTLSRPKSRARGQPVHERLYNLAKGNIIKAKERLNVGSHDFMRSTPTRQRTVSRQASSDRLYNLARRKREMEEKRRKLKAEEELQDDLKPRILNLESKRSYTPQRERIYAGGHNIHTRLYNLAESKKAQLKSSGRNSKRASSIPRKRPSETSKGVERLYGHSLSMRLKGQARRQEIEEKYKKRAPTPTGRISIQQAKGIYQRGMMMKLELEVKREDEGHMPYVSPLLNPLLPADDEQGFETNHQTPVGQRSASMSRSRTTTPRRSINSNNRSMSTNRAISRTRLRERSSTPITSIPRNASSAATSTVRNHSRTSVNRVPSQAANGRNISRIRARSRLRAPAAGAHSNFRTPSPKVTRVNSSNSSNPWSVPGPSFRDRSMTPQRAIRQSSIKDMLRKMEEDVSFYNNVKRAIARKEKMESGGELSIADSESYAASTASGKSDGSNVIQRLQEMTKSVEGSSYDPCVTDKPRPSLDLSLGQSKHGLLVSNNTLRTEIDSDASASYLRDESQQLPSAAQQQYFLVRPRSIDYCD